MSIFDGLATSVQNLVASNPASLPLVINLLKNANVPQQKAIGAGLGNAANLCNVPDPKFATEIADALAKATSTPAQIQFALSRASRPDRWPVAYHPAASAVQPIR